MKKKIAIICGGKSPEHEISIRSVKNVVEALDRHRFEPVLIGISKEGTWYHFADLDILKNIKSLSDQKKPAGLSLASLMVIDGKSCLYLLDGGQKLHLDAVFPILHGSYGEDGTLQGLIRMMNLPLIGCDVFASAAGMDKEVMKRLLQQAQIPSARYVLLTSMQSASYEELTQKLGSPFFIKPANAGSSVGVHKVKSAQDFQKQLKDSFLYDSKVLAEEFIEGREVECAVLGHTYSAKASVPGEIIPQHEFYSYEAKYLDDNGAILKIPADLRPETTNKIQQLAVKVFETFLCEGLTRVDFFVRKKDGEVFVNELNTLPGFTSISMYPKMWEASGVSYKSLITQLIDLGLEKFEIDQRVATNYKDLNQ
jgi:D-alanine-D-alanine ligase